MTKEFYDGKVRPKSMNDGYWSEDDLARVCLNCGQIFYEHYGYLCNFETTKILIEIRNKDLLLSLLTKQCEGKPNPFGVIDVKDELILRIPLDDVDKLQYALNRVWLTGNEHVDSVLSTFNDVLKEERAKK